MIVYFATGGNSSTMIIGMCIMAAISAAHVFCMMMHWATRRYNQSGIQSPQQTEHTAVEQPEPYNIKEIEIIMKHNDDIVVKRVENTDELSVVIIQNP